MKRVIIITIGLLLAATALLSFGKITNDDNKPMKNDYENLWKTFEENLSNELPESAAKTLDKNKRYDNLEMYLHYLVREIIGPATAGTGETYLKLN